jgi:hypothetical protein
MDPAHPTDTGSEQAVSRVEPDVDVSVGACSWLELLQLHNGYLHA